MLSTLHFLWEQQKKKTKINPKRCFKIITEILWDRDIWITLYAYQWMACKCSSLNYFFMQALTHVGHVVSGVMVWACFTRCASHRVNPFPPEQICPKEEKKIPWNYYDILISQLLGTMIIRICLQTFIAFASTPKCCPYASSISLLGYWFLANLPSRKSSSSHCYLQFTAFFLLLK